MARQPTGKSRGHKPRLPEGPQARLAYCALGLLGLMVLFGGVSALFSDSEAFERIKGIFQYAFGSISTLVAAAFGYFYRGKA